MATTSNKRKLATSSRKPSVKRQRSLRESGDNNLNQAISLKDRTRIDGLWFKDGSLVLATPTHIFRVYKGVLEQKSKFFRSQLSSIKPTKLTDNDSFEGTRVIHLTDDWEDVEVFLRVCFNPK